MTFEERFEKKVSELAKRRATYQATSGCKHLDAAIMRFLRIGGEDLGAQLKPIIIELRECLSKADIKHKVYHYDTLGDAVCVETCTACQRTKTLARLDEFFGGGDESYE